MRKLLSLSDNPLYAFVDDLIDMPDSQDNAQEREPCRWATTYDGVQLLCDLSGGHGGDHVLHLGPATGVDEVLLVPQAVDPIEPPPGR